MEDPYKVNATPSATSEFADAMRGRKGYEDNIPAWNFVQGNLVTENTTLRRNNRLLVIAAIIAIVLSPVISLTVSYHYMLTGRPRFIAVPVNHAGAVVAPAISAQFSPGTATQAEEISRIRQVFRALFTGSVEPSLNRYNVRSAALFMLPAAQTQFAVWRNQNRSHRDAVFIGSQGYQAFVRVTNLVMLPISTQDTYEVHFTQTIENPQGKVVFTTARVFTVSVVSVPSDATLDNPFGVKISSFTFGVGE